MSVYPTVHVTGHNAEKQSVFIDSHTPSLFKERVAVLYKTAADGPADTNNDNDLQWFSSTDHYPIPKEGVSCAVVNFAPGHGLHESGMHRTLTVDVAVVLDGEIESVLDSGEKRVIKKGEVLIQRGTNHDWVNRGDVTARLLCFIVPAKRIEGAEGNLAGT